MAKTDITQGAQKTDTYTVGVDNSGISNQTSLTNAVAKMVGVISPTGALVEKYAASLDPKDVPAMLEKVMNKVNEFVAKNSPSRPVKLDMELGALQNSISKINTMNTTKDGPPPPPPRSGGRSH